MFGGRSTVFAMRNGVDGDADVFVFRMADVVTDSSAVIGAFAVIQRGPVIVRNMGNQPVDFGARIGHDGEIGHGPQIRMTPDSPPSTQPCGVSILKIVGVSVHEATIAKEIRSFHAVTMPFG